MPTKGLTYAGQVTFHDPSIDATHASGLWKNCPLLAAKFKPGVVVVCDDQFTSYNAAATTGDFILTQATSGSAALSTTYIGALAVDAGAATANQGANIQRARTLFLPAANKSIWFETKVRMATTVNAQLFFGLAEIDTTVIAAGAMSTSNHIGFSSVTGDGVMLANSKKAGTGTTGTGVTLSTSAFNYLGFFYDGVADTVQFYANGVAVGSAFATANIPKVAIYPTIVVQANGSGQPVAHVQGMRTVQIV